MSLLSLPKELHVSEPRLSSSGKVLPSVRHLLFTFCVSGFVFHSSLSSSYPLANANANANANLSSPLSSLDPHVGYVNSCEIRELVSRFSKAAYSPLVID